MPNTRLFVITGPSGAGLREIVSGIFARRSDLGTVVPVTARKMKEGEENGAAFFFYDLDGWNELKASGDLLETTEFAGNDYGTSRRLVREQLESGKNVLLMLETARAEQVKANMPEAVCVWVAPKDPELLKARYEKTARSGFEVSVRMETAQKEEARSCFCDARIDSADPEAAIGELDRLIDRETGR